jgi:hypothetical protein
MRPTAAGAARASVVAIGIVITVLVVAAFSIVPQRTAYDSWSALFIGPILLVISLPVLAREARRQNDRRLFWILVLALILKLLGGVARNYVGEEVYAGVADASGYHGDGVAISANLRAGVFETGLDSFTRTDFISLFTGIVYTFTGPSQWSGFLVYSWLGFWGLFLFYRSFTIALPEGQRRLYACLVFFLPSLLYWPSSIGKEAWMLFALGIAAFGAARILTGRMWGGFAIAGLGLWLAGIVRLHVAGMVAVALAFAYIVYRPERTTRRLNMLARVFSIAAVVGLTIVVVLQAEQSLRSSGIDTRQGITRALNNVAERTNTGDSSFQPSVLRSPGRVPEAVITVLFRPLPYEAHNTQALIASVETFLLLMFCLVRWRWIWAAVRNFRRRPYVAMALAYTGAFILGFSSFANLGLLARQRVQLLPFLLVLLCVPSRRRSVPGSQRGRAQARLDGPADAWDAPLVDTSVSDPNPRIRMPRSGGTTEELGAFPD